MKSINKLIFVSVLVFIAAFSRLLPHPPNFTAVAAMGLFAGFALRSNWFTYLIPLLALFLSDLVINNVLYAEYYNGFTLLREGFWWVAVPMLASVVMAPWIIKKLSVTNVLLASIAGSAVFFLGSNFGAWVADPMYPATLSGLIACYVAGLPFLLNTLLGTMVYGALFFGGYAYVSQSSSLKFV